MMQSKFQIYFECYCFGKFLETAPSFQTRCSHCPNCTDFLLFWSLAFQSNIFTRRSLTCRWRSCWHCWHSEGRSPFAQAAWSDQVSPGYQTYWRRMVRPSLQLLQSACPRRGYNLQWHWPSERKIVKRKTISVLNLDTGFRAASRWAWTKVEDVIRVPVVVLKLRDRHSNLRLERRCIFANCQLPTSWLIRLCSFWIFATSRSFSLLMSLDFSFRTEFCDSRRSTFDFTYCGEIEKWELLLS